MIPLFYSDDKVTVSYFGRNLNEEINLSAYQHLDYTDVFEFPSVGERLDAGFKMLADGGWDTRD